MLRAAAGHAQCADAVRRRDMRMNKGLVLIAARIAFVVALAFAGYAAFAPAREAPQLLPWDKAEHFIAFYALTGLCCAAFPRLHLAVIAGLMSAMGAGIEFIQATPLVARDASVWDWVADTLAIGAALAPMVAPALRRWLSELS
jgi:VanZ family protein